MMDVAGYGREPPYRFDASRMMLIDVPLPDGRGADNRPPYVVLTTPEVIRERPELEPYLIPRDDGFTVWAGDDPDNPTTSVYVSLPDQETFLTLAGDPNPRPVAFDSLTVTTSPPEADAATLGPFDPEIFDPNIFDTGAKASAGSDEPPSEPLLVHDAVSATTASSPDLVFHPAQPSQVDLNRMEARFRSAEWTGIERRIAASPQLLREVEARIRELDRMVERCGLTNLEQQKAKALTGALIHLLNSPQPAWRIIVAILNTPELNALWRLGEVAGVLFTLGHLLLG